MSERVFSIEAGVQSIVSSNVYGLLITLSSSDLLLYNTSSLASSSNQSTRLHIGLEIKQIALSMDNSFLALHLLENDRSLIAIASFSEIVTLASQNATLKINRKIPMFEKVFSLQFSNNESNQLLVCGIQDPDRVVCTYNPDSTLIKCFSLPSVNYASWSPNASDPKFVASYSDATVRVHSILREDETEVLPHPEEGQCAVFCHFLIDEKEKEKVILIAYRNEESDETKVNLCRFNNDEWKFEGGDILCGYTQEEEYFFVNYVKEMDLFCIGSSIIEEINVFQKQSNRWKIVQISPLSLKTDEDEEEDDSIFYLRGLSLSFNFTSVNLPVLIGSSVGGRLSGFSIPTSGFKVPITTPRTLSLSSFSSESKPTSSMEEKKKNNEVASAPKPFISAFGSSASVSAFGGSTSTFGTTSSFTSGFGKKVEEKSTPTTAFPSTFSISGSTGSGFGKSSSASTSGISNLLAAVTTPSKTFPPTFGSLAGSGFGSNSSTPTTNLFQTPTTSNNAPFALNKPSTIFGTPTDTTSTKASKESDFENGLFIAFKNLYSAVDPSKGSDENCRKVAEKYKSLPLDQLFTSLGKKYSNEQVKEFKATVESASAQSSSPDNTFGGGSSFGKPSSTFSIPGGSSFASSSSGLGKSLASSFSAASPSTFGKTDDSKNTPTKSSFPSTFSTSSAGSGFGSSSSFAVKSSSFTSGFAPKTTNEDKNITTPSQSKFPSAFATPPGGSGFGTSSGFGGTTSTFGSTSTFGAKSTFTSGFGGKTEEKITPTTTAFSSSFGKATISETKKVEEVTKLTSGNVNDVEDALFHAFKRLYAKDIAKRSDENCRKVAVKYATGPLETLYEQLAKKYTSDELNKFKSDVQMKVRKETSVEVKKEVRKEEKIEEPKISNATEGFPQDPIFSDKKNELVPPDPVFSTKKKETTSPKGKTPLTTSFPPDPIFSAKKKEDTASPKRKLSATSKSPPDPIFGLKKVDESKKESFPPDPVFQPLKKEEKKQEEEKKVDDKITVMLPKKKSITTKPPAEIQNEPSALKLSLTPSFNENNTSMVTTANTSSKISNDTKAGLSSVTKQIVDSFAQTLKELSNLKIVPIPKDDVQKDKFQKSMSALNEKMGRLNVSLADADHAKYKKLKSSLALAERQITEASSLYKNSKDPNYIAMIENRPLDETLKAELQEMLNKDNLIDLKLSEVFEVLDARLKHSALPLEGPKAEPVQYELLNTLKHHFQEATDSFTALVAIEATIEKDILRKIQRSATTTNATQKHTEKQETVSDRNAHLKKVAEALKNRKNKPSPSPFTLVDSGSTPLKENRREDLVISSPILMKAKTPVLFEVPLKPQTVSAKKESPLQPIENEDKKNATAPGPLVTKSKKRAETSEIKSESAVAKEITFSVAEDKTPPAFTFGDSKAPPAFEFGGDDGVTKTKEKKKEEIEEIGAGEEEYSDFGFSSFGFEKKVSKNTIAPPTSAILQKSEINKESLKMPTFNTPAALATQKVEVKLKNPFAAEITEEGKVKQKLFEAFHNFYSDVSPDKATEEFCTKNAIKWFPNIPGLLDTLSKKYSADKIEKFKNRVNQPNEKRIETKSLAPAASLPGSFSAPSNLVTSAPASTSGFAFGKTATPPAPNQSGTFTSPGGSFTSGFGKSPSALTPSSSFPTSFPTTSPASNAFSGAFGSSNASINKPFGSSTASTNKPFGASSAFGSPTTFKSTPTATNFQTPSGFNASPSGFNTTPSAFTTPTSFNSSKGNMLEILFTAFKQLYANDSTKASDDNCRKVAEKYQSTPLDQLYTSLAKKYSLQQIQQFKATVEGATGQQQQQPQTSSGGFGGGGFGKPSTSGFGATSTSGFGATSTSGFGATNTSGFGKPASTGFNASSGFGNTSTSSFGAPSSSGFGTSTSSGFGNATTSSFGSPSAFNTNASPSTFGSTSAFGKSNTTGFGGGGFGGAKTSAFGAGATNSSSGFGNQTNSGFGLVQSTTLTGQAPNKKPFSSATFTSPSNTGFSSGFGAFKI